MKANKKRFTKILAVTIAFIFALPMLPPAIVTRAEIASGKCGDKLTWVLEDNGELIIRGTGEMYDFTGELDENMNLIDNSPWKDFTDKVTMVSVRGGVTCIGAYAFVFPNLLSVSLPDTLTSIHTGGFQSCSSLMEIELPQSVTSIGDFAFQGCSNLTSFTIPAGVKTISEGVFYQCVSLSEIVIPNGVTSIGDNAFYWCSGLKSVSIPDTVKTIGNQAFQGCQTLMEITLPASLNSIGYEAFWECKQLSSIDIPARVTEIGDHVFDYCENLDVINVDSANASYSSADGVLFNKNQTELLCYPAGKYGGPVEGPGKNRQDRSPAGCNGNDAFQPGKNRRGIAEIEIRIHYARPGRFPVRLL